MTNGQARLAAIGIFFALLLAWGGGSLRTQDRMQDQVDALEAQVQVAEDAYAEELIHSARWAEVYLAERESLQGMICIDKALTPGWLPRVD